MITTNRRRQFGGVDDRIKVYHPDWWYVEFYLSAANISVGVTSQFVPTIKEVVETPKGATVTAVDQGFKGDKAGTYKLYYTKFIDMYRRGSYSHDSVQKVRLPISYYTAAATELYDWNGGGVQHNDINFYFLNTTPKANMIDSWAATNRDKAHIHLYVPKGSLQAYATFNSTWETIYNEGRLHEWEFKIIED